MLLPTVAIVGRPNVGKSRLFNRLTGRTISIVDPTAGVTRDRILHEVRRQGWRFDLVDTGGIGIVDVDHLEVDVEKQITRAIETADRIILLVDGRDGLHPLDRDIAERLRPLKAKIVLAVNKLDHPDMDGQACEFIRLGFGTPLGISAEHGRGLDELIEAVGEGLPREKELAEAESASAQEGRVRICLAGRRNVGKSSLANAFLGEERMIVADLPGTTRDSVDAALDHRLGRFLLIDTAGLRKKKQLHEDLEFYAACRTERSIQRADVVLLLLDATDEIGAVDKKIAHYCEVAAKPTIVVINKMDLAGEARSDEAWREWLTDRLPGVAHAPMAFTCAVRAEGLDTLLTLAQELLVESRARLPTAELNRLVEAAVQRRRPRKVGPGHTKIYYATQTGIEPPTFVIFVNRADWVEPGYARYLENYLRAHGPFPRTALRIVFKARASRFHEQEDEKPRRNAGTKAERKAHLIVPKGSKGGKGAPAAPGRMRTTEPRKRPGRR